MNFVPYKAKLMHVMSVIYHKEINIYKCICRLNNYYNYTRNLLM